MVDLIDPAAPVTGLDRGERLTAVTAAIDLWMDHPSRRSMMEAVDDARKLIVAQRAMLERAKRALEPFAKAADKRQVLCEDTERVTWSAITVGDLRAARQAVAEIGDG